MNICIIGLGSMGKRRIRLLKELVPDYILVGIDRNPQRVDDVKKQFGVDCYSSLEDIGMHLDCAFICTSPQSHAHIIQDCLQKNCHVFSEINLIDDLYDENIQLADERERVLFLSSTPMYKEEMQFIDNKVTQNGKVCVYHYHVGQYLPDWHPWDNLKDFFVSNKLTNGCRELLAIELPWIQKTFGKIKSINVTKRKLTNLDIDFPDTYIMQIEHENGNAGNLIVDVVSRHAVRNFEVINEDIYIRWNGTPGSLFEKDIVSGELRAVGEEQYVHENGYADFINEYAYMKEIEDFFEVIKSGKEALYSFEKDKEILAIINQIEK